jgi:hypothetical protein
MVWIQTFNLYFFKDGLALMAYNSDLDKEFVIPYEKATKSFLNIEMINEVEDKIVALEKLVQIEELLKLSQEESEVEEDAPITDITGTTDNAEIIPDTISENEGEKTESVSETEILPQVSKEEKESPISESTQG